MKSTVKRGVVCAGSIVLALASTPADARAQDITNHEAAIRALIEETRQANNAGDVERWVALFDDDFVYMAPGAPAVTTREALIEVAGSGYRRVADFSHDEQQQHVLTNRNVRMLSKFGGRVGPGTALLLTMLANPGVGAAQNLPSPEACEAGPTLTYLANAAVLIRGTHTVLIDGPFTDGVDPYPKLTPETLSRARAAEPPFDEIDWVFITHAHTDHGDARAIAELLEANRTARLVSTRAVVEQVRDATTDGFRLADRLVVAEPAEDDPIVVNIEAPRIEALALHHGRHRTVQRGQVYCLDPFFGPFATLQDSKH